MANHTRNLHAGEAYSSVSAHSSGGSSASVLEVDVVEVYVVARKLRAAHEIHCHRGARRPSHVYVMNIANLHA